MIHIKHTLAVLLLAVVGISTSVMAADIIPLSKNSIKVVVPRVKSTITTPTEQNSSVTYQFTDGLGRPTMTVQKSATPTGKDLVNLTALDAAGRVTNQWLPTPMTAAAIPTVSTVMTAAQSFYNDTRPYSTINYLGDVDDEETEVQLYKPGNKWFTANKPQQQELKAETLVRYRVQGTGVKLYNSDANLQAVFVEGTDEDGNKTYEYIDDLGKTIMQRTVANATNHDTYYVYNDMGQLCFVLSPEATSRMTTPGTTYYVGNKNTDNNPLSQYAYVYRYDAKGQCIAKKLPGKDWSYMVYDRGGRLAFSIEGNQSQTDLWVWTFYKYDALNRLVQSGTTKYDIESPPNYDTQDAFATFTSSGYTYSAPLGTQTRVLTQNFYDSYLFRNLAFSQELKTNLDFDTQAGGARYSNVVNGVDIATLGKLTGTMVAELKSSGTIWSAMYYDEQGRVIQSRANNHLGGFDNDTYTYNFAGQVTANNHKHTGPNVSISENYTYDYDTGGRLTAIHYLIPSKGNTKQGTVLMDSLVYDEVGRVKQKWIHAKIQTIDYTYNVRNQLKSITTAASLYKRFSEQINYADDDPTSTGTYYNGNITSVSYGDGSTYKYKYNYAYDGMNRLTEAVYTDLVNSANTGNYTEKFKTYDLNSNIKELTRSGLVKDFKNMQGTTPNIVQHDMDQLTMTYAGNQVKAITDGNLTSEYASVGGNDFVDKQSATQPTEYFYDANGNQTADFNKGIAWIKYNLLNLPEKVQFTNGNKIEYNYYADGSKKQAIYYTTVNYHNIPIGETTTENFDISSTFTQDYCGKYIYENNQLKRVLTPEGYAKFNGTNTNYYWTYLYNLKDHLGNTHVTLESMPFPYYPFSTNSVRGTTEYYPSGMEIRPTATNASGTNTYLYGGKELDRMHGLNEYDFSARWYDYAGPAFTTMDPHAENHYSESPYSYCAGDPVNRTDPTGMDWYIQRTDPNVYGFTQGNKSWVKTSNGEYWDRIGAEIDVTKNGITYHGDSSGRVTRVTPLDDKSTEESQAINWWYLKQMTDDVNVEVQRDYKIVDGQYFKVSFNKKNVIKAKKPSIITRTYSFGNKKIAKSVTVGTVTVGADGSVTVGSGISSAGVNVNSKNVLVSISVPTGISSSGITSSLGVDVEINGKLAAGAVLLLVPEIRLFGAVPALRALGAY